MNALLSILYQKSIEFAIKSTLLLMADKRLLKYLSLNSGEVIKVGVGAMFTNLLLKP